MKHQNIVIGLVFIFISYSCSTNKIKLDLPDELYNSENTIHVKGTRGKGLVGTKRNLVFDKFYSGKLKEGWTKTSDIVDKTPGGLFSKTANQRMLYENIGIDIDDVTSKQSDKFQFTLSDSLETMVVFCKQEYIGKSTNYNIINKINFSEGKSQKSDFSATFISLKDTLKMNWELELKYGRETPNGIIQAFLDEGMPIETGFVTNKTDTIVIKPVFLKGKKMDNNQYASIINIVGGYEFSIGDKKVGIVDLFNQTIGLLQLNSEYNTIMVAAASSILLKNR